MKTIRKERAAKLSILILMLFVLLFMGCAKTEENEQEVQEVQEVQDTDFEIDNEEVYENIGINGEPSLQEDENKVELEENSVFTNVIEKENDTDETLASYVVDLDLDGVNEAFVVDGYPSDYNDASTPESNTWEISKIWFVDEEMKAHELDDLFLYGERIDVFEEQYAKQIGNQNYLIINGQCGAEGIGTVYTVVNDKLINTVENNCDGQKRFTDKDLIWYKEIYGMTMEQRDNLSLTETSTGRCYMPYHMYLEDNKFKLYDAKEISEDELAAIKSLDIEGIKKSADAVQYILRDNNELDINYVEKDGDEYNFKADIYMLSFDGKTSEYIEIVDGYFAVDVNDYNAWDYFEEGEID